MSMAGMYYKGATNTAKRFFVCRICDPLERDRAFLAATVYAYAHHLQVMVVLKSLLTY